MENVKNVGRVRQFLSRNNRSILWGVLGITAYAHLLMINAALKGELPTVTEADLTNDKEEFEEWLTNMSDKLGSWFREKNKDTTEHQNGKKEPSS